MASMSGCSRSTTAAYSWLRIAGMTHLMLMLIPASLDDPDDPFTRDDRCQRRKNGL